MHNHDKRYWAGVVGRNVLKVRTARGLSSRDLSEMVTARGHRLSQSSISMIERNEPTSAQGGYISLTVDRMMALADCLGVSYLTLLNEDTR